MMRRLPHGLAPHSDPLVAPTPPTLLRPSTLP